MPEPRWTFGPTWEGSFCAGGTQVCSQQENAAWLQAMENEVASRVNARKAVAALGRDGHGRFGRD